MAKFPLKAALIIIIQLLISILLYSGCAKNLAPPGGPADLEPPTLVMTTPTSGTTGVDLNQKIEILFSERINENSVGQAIFISPPLKVAPRVHTKGNRLVIEPEVPLDSGRTYVVSIAASLQDLRGNKLPNSISFAFSTGTIIDSAKVSGRVFRDFQPLRNFRVFAFENSDTLTDSIFTMIPSYVTETGDSGDFEINFMTPGEYLILGAEDKDRDNLINRAGEQVALPISLATASQEGGTVTLHVTSFDSTSLKLINCSGVEGTVKLRFDTALDSISARNSVIAVSTVDSSFTLPSVWLLSAASELMAYSPSFTVGGEFDLSVRGVRSLTQRHLPGDSVSCSVRITERDEGPPAVVGHTPAIRNLILPQDTLGVVFSEPVTVDEGALRLVVDTTEVDTLTPFVVDHTSLGFMLPPAIEPDKQVKAILDLTAVKDLYGNSPQDSSYSFTFITGNPDSLGSLSGTIVGADKNLVVELTGVRAHLYYRYSGMSDSTFKWPLYPDLYRITGYLDLNEDGRWNLGEMRPFHYAEPGWIAADSVRIRARFDHEGKVLQFE